MDKLYDDLVMDHIKNVRNFRALDDADRHARGTNPLCGDDVTVYLRFEGDLIGDIGFRCTCCGVSMASASIMSEHLKGLSAAEAKAAIPAFVALLNANDAAGADVDAARRAVVATVREFPARTRCAVLPWLTLEAALNDQRELVYRR
jgi:nitrogen fixation protein NifU and related proteins